MIAIVISRRAREDFKRIRTYIALDDDRAADRLLLALDARIEKLRDFPGIGTSHDGIRPGARTLVHASQSIAPYIRPVTPGLTRGPAFCTGREKRDPGSSPG